ncbi:MAG: sulfurtransferase [Ectothiorhodospiraceae bacterium]|nr:sulfurtransferase [Ectothiorhodospiraceae bacterium]
MLVERQWVAQHLDDPHLRILDCTTYMFPQPVGPSRIESGRPDYEAAHIPGAQHVDMCDDLSDPDGAYPYTLPQPAQFERLMTRLGISSEHHVVLYGRASVLPVTRAWFVLRVMGHRKLSVLNGGFEGWQRDGYPVTAEEPSFAPAPYRANPRPHHVAQMRDVENALYDPRCLLVNALSPEQFCGTGGAHYGRPGRIPGSVNVPAQDLVDPDTMRFRSPDHIRTLLTEAGVPGSRRVITYCGGGIAASTAAFALELLGYTDWALYDNSLLEWSAKPQAPMESGCAE